MPNRANPKRLQLALNSATFSQDELGVLREIADLHARTGRPVHIHAVTRGVSVDTRKSVARIRRLQLHANRAIAALVHYGVPQTSITTSTAEQRMTGVSLDATTAADRDRLELSLQ